VCNVLRAGGLFGDAGAEMNCAETTNWDVYVLNLFGSPTQIMGQYSMNLNNLGSKEPYPHYAETCSSLPPVYEKAEYC